MNKVFQETINILKLHTEYQCTKILGSYFCYYTDFSNLRDINIYFNIAYLNNSEIFVAETYKDIWRERERGGGDRKGERGREREREREEEREKERERQRERQRETERETERETKRGTGIETEKT